MDDKSQNQLQARLDLQKAEMRQRYNRKNPKCADDCTNIYYGLTNVEKDKVIEELYPAFIAYKEQYK